MLESAVSTLRRRLGLFALILLAATGTASQAVPAPNALYYQSRYGRYSEGVKAEPVSGYDIELLSAMVDFQEPTTQLPVQLQTRFYLGDTSSVDIVIREHDAQFFYWLDRVKPSSGTWRAGHINDFAWPTSTVLAHLGHISIYALGVLVRLGKTVPSSIEYVAPAALYHTRAPASAAGYVFTLRTNSDVRLTYSVYREGSSVPIMTQRLSRVPSDRSFAIRWDARRAIDADYRLVISGFTLDTNRPILQIVRFHHRAKLG